MHEGIVKKIAWSYKMFKKKHYSLMATLKMYELIKKSGNIMVSQIWREMSHKNIFLRSSSHFNSFPYSAFAFFALLSLDH